MTKPTTLKFGEFLIKVGDGADPEVFAAPCGLTSKGFNASADTTDDSVPDCDNPDAPAWKERSVTAIARDISGSGVLSQEFLQTWDDWFVSGLPKNCQVEFGDLVWTGPYVLSTFNVSADQGAKLKVTVALQSAGEITRAAAS